MHLHHIIPRHLGGTNEPDNLVKVTVEEHAEIHRCLWVLGGRWQDKVAWLALSKQIGKEDAQRLAASFYMSTRTVTKETRKKIKESRDKQVFSEESKQKRKETWKKKMEEGFIRSFKGYVPWNKGKKTGPQSEETKAKYKGRVSWNKGLRKET